MAQSFSIRSLSGGPGTSYLVASEGISGVRGFGVKSADTDLHFADGSVASRDHKSTRMVSIPIIVRSTVAGLNAALTALETAFAPSSVDINLTVTTVGTHVLSGRPRGLEIDDSFGDGTARALALFEVMGG